MDQQDDAPRQQEAARAPSRMRRFRLALFGRLSGWLLRGLGLSWRFIVIGQDPRTVAPTQPGGDKITPAEASPKTPGLLAAFFHESLLPAAFRFRDRGYSVAVSRSRDGDLIESTLLRMGYKAPARGSSSRGGGAALLGLVRKIEAETTVAVLVDGPRGPARVSKPGIIALARLTGQPIQPVAFAAKPAIRLSSWDGSLIPLPFAKVACAFGEPFVVSENESSDEEMAAAAEQLDIQLIELYRQAEAAIERET